MDPSSESEWDSAFREAVAAVRQEHQRRLSEATGALWRTGDVVRGLRLASTHGTWRRTLGAFAAVVGVSSARLDDAARSSSAFPIGQREALLDAFGRMGVTLTPSHVIELARASPTDRALGIEALRSSYMSTRLLRRYLKDKKKEDRADCATVAQSTEAKRASMDKRLPAL
jgi:hypothetical protein